MFVQIQESTRPYAARVLALQCLLSLLLAAPMATAEVTKSIDARAEKSDDRAYYVVFCARKSERWGTGHAFVVWVEHDGQGGDVQSQAYGFYPRAERFGLSQVVGPGAVIDESTKPASTERELLTHRLVVRVDRDAYFRSQNVRAKWATTRFRLLRQNCTHFVRDIAKTIGLATPAPESMERPSPYLSRVMSTPIDLGETRSPVMIATRPGKSSSRR